MRAIIKKSIANGIITAPPSKSYTHRLLIAAGLSNQDVEISNVVVSDDIMATINCLRTLGKNINIINDTVVIKTSKTISELDDNLIFDCNESGSTLRFFVPIALTTGKKVTFKGSERLIERGITSYENILKKQDIKILKNHNSITLIGQLHNDVFEIKSNISSQFISGLLFASPLLEGNTKIIVPNNLESISYVDMTIDVLEKSHIVIKKEINQYIIDNLQTYYLENTTVEGDYSNSAFLETFNYIGGNVIVEGLNSNSLQGDKVYRKYFELLSLNNTTIDISNCIDLGPILFCFSSIKHGGHFIKTARLKVKESDRVNELAEELAKFNVKVIDLGDEVIIDNSMIKAPTEILNGHNDHRIIMALSVMLTLYGGIIDGVEAVKKSYPDFFNNLKKINIEVEVND